MNFLSFKMWAVLGIFLILTIVAAGGVWLAAHIFPRDAEPATSEREIIEIEEREDGGPGDSN